MTGPGGGSYSNGGGERADATAHRLISFLRVEGAARCSHAGRRSLLEHLVGTYDILRRWNQPAWLQHAALIHSVYGTDAYHQQLLPVARRGDVAQVAGDHAERLAYLFGVTPRKRLFGGMHVWARDVPTARSGPEQEAADDPPATRDELDALVLLHMANLAEQASAADGSPGPWLARLRELGELLIDSDAVRLPLFVAALASVSEEDESQARRAYAAGIAAGDDPGRGADALALAASLCPVVPEPCIWQAYLSRSRGDVAMAARWARAARRRLLALGTPWDKRLTFDEWLRLTRLLERPGEADFAEPPGAITEPRGLLDALSPAPGHHDPAARAAARPQRATAPEPAEGLRRFHRYLDTFADPEGDAARRIYPDLDSRPWFDPADFPVADYLQSRYEDIREEILALDASRFHPESERIERSGGWDVAFFYERGRRRDEVCEACPVTAQGLESHGSMRTMAGLIYVSRMRAGTHIAAHRGPTNLRVRCHLGITVPPGDCAIRVGEETRHWTEGACLVFDDYFEHEAWNYADEDRIVLIVDLWHPGLSMTEVRLLEGLHRYAHAHARQLNRYWASNAAAAGRSTQV